LTSAFAFDDLVLIFEICFFLLLDKVSAMRFFNKAISVGIVSCVCSLIGSAAVAVIAANGTSFVSNSGDDGNSCAATSPCRSFQHAHDVTADNGVVIALDPVFDQNPLVITKGMKFLSHGSAAADQSTISVVSGNAVTVNAPPNVGVTFINFNIQGGATGSNGIQFNTGGSLTVLGGQITAFGAGAPNGFGIRFQPSGVSVLSVEETSINSNGSGATGGGIQISPVGAAGGAQVILTRARLEFNRFGFAIDTTNSSNGVNAVVTGSSIRKNFQDGIVVVGGSPIGVLVDQTVVFASSGFGVRAIGANVTARLKGSSIAGNGTGVAGVNGGVIQSYGNNSIDANGTNGTATLIPLK
jgi:hypothetical protein